LDRREKGLLRSLAEKRDALAVELGLAPETLAPNRELELMIQAASGVAIERPDSWTGWRAAVAIAPLQARAQQLVAGDVHAD
jgi:hypothetical protein